MATKIIVIEVSELQAMLNAAIQEAVSQVGSTKILTINEVAKIIGRSHKKVKSLCTSGAILTTADGCITENELQNYLRNK